MALQDQNQNVALMQVESNPNVLSLNDNNVPSLDSQYSPSPTTTAEEPLTLDYTKDYGNTLDYLGSQVQSAGLETKEAFKAIGVKTGISEPYTPDEIDSQQAQLDANDYLQAHTSLAQKALGIVPSLFIDPEIVGGAAVAKLGTTALSMSANALRAGKIMDLSPFAAANPILYRSIGLGLDGAAFSGGYTGVANLDADALNRNFDYSEYAKNLLMFSAMGAALPYAISSKAGQAVISGSVTAYNAIKNGLSPMLGSVAVKAGLRQASVDTAQSVMAKDVDSLLDNQISPTLDKQAQLIQDNIQSHNAARESLRLPTVDTPDSTINSVEDKVIPIKSPEQVYRELGITPDVEDISYTSPIDEAISRGFRENNNELLGKIADMTGASIDDIKQHAELVNASRDAELNAGNTTLPPIFSPLVDHVKPFINEEYATKMGLLLKTPYTDAENFIKGIQHNDNIKLVSLMDRKISGLATPEEEELINNLRVRQNASNDFLSQLPEKEIDYLSSLPKFFNEAVDTVNSTALRHQILSKQLDFINDGLNDSGEAYANPSEEQVRKIFNIPEDADNAQRLKGFIQEGENAPVRQDNEDLWEEYNDLNPEEIKSKTLQSEIENLKAVKQDMQNYRPWLKKLASCLSRND